MSRRRAASVISSISEGEREGRRRGRRKGGEGGGRREKGGGEGGGKEEGRRRRGDGGGRREKEGEGGGKEEREEKKRGKELFSHKGILASVSFPPLSGLGACMSGGGTLEVGTPCWAAGLGFISDHASLGLGGCGM